MKTKSSVAIMLMALLGLFCMTRIVSAAGPAWTLVWSDEFSGSSIDTTYWNVENSSSQSYRGQSPILDPPECGSTRRLAEINQ
jgi:hypothetical protein